MKAPTNPTIGILSTQLHRTTWEEAAAEGFRDYTKARPMSYSKEDAADRSGTEESWKARGYVTGYRAAARGRRSAPDFSRWISQQ